MSYSIKFFEAKRNQKNCIVSFVSNDKKISFGPESFNNVYRSVYKWLYDNDHDFSTVKSVYNNYGEFYKYSDLQFSKYERRLFVEIDNNLYFLNVGNTNQLISHLKRNLQSFGVSDLVIDVNENDIEDFEEDLKRTFVVRAGRSNADSNLFIEGDFVGIGYGLNFNVNDKSKEEIFQFLTQNGSSKNQSLQYVQQIELFKEISLGDIVLVPDSEGINVGEVSSDIYYVDEKYPNRLEVEWLDKIERNNSVNLPRTVFEIKNFDIENYEFTPTNEIVPELTPVDEPEEEIQKFSNLFPKSFKAVQAQEEREKTIEKKFVKNPFGCKQEDSTQTSSLCILGKSGSGKTTTTEQALDQMGHEYLLYIPIEGEYTFSQYTGEGFEMSSLGEFVMRAQNDPSRCYTVIFDECHRPITISKLNTDLLQALSSRRNRGGERFFTMDRVTKRMYTTPTEEFPIPLKEKSGKILVPDNFGIVCLSSQPAVICRNEDFLNRVDLSVFQKSNRGLTDITLLDKIDKSKIKGTELTSDINALLANEGE